MRTCYIKPTRKKHSSGFRTFEVGYITKMEGNRVIEKEIITDGADHIYNGYSYLYDPSSALGINMDITDDGYIRIWTSSKEKLCWPDMSLSSMEMMKEALPKEAKQTPFIGKH